MALANRGHCPGSNATVDQPDDPWAHRVDVVVHRAVLRRFTPGWDRRLAPRTLTTGGEDVQYFFDEPDQFLGRFRN